MEYATNLRFTDYVENGNPYMFTDIAYRSTEERQTSSLGIGETTVDAHPTDEANS